MLSHTIKVIPLRSGSSGNAVFITSHQTRLLIDAGVNARMIEQSLASIGETANNLDGLLVTHEHSDHISGVGVLMRRHRVPLYVNEKTWMAMRTVIGPVDESLVRLIDTGSQTSIGDLSMTTFSVPHDAADPVGYKIDTERGPITVLTDIGRMNSELLAHAAGSKVVLIEANYDRTLLMAGPYPMMLKQRICGDYGHLSNDDSALAVATLLDRGTSHFYLYHLSEQNNYPELALLTVKNHLQSIGARIGQDLFLDVARRFTVSEPIGF